MPKNEFLIRCSAGIIILSILFTPIYSCAQGPYTHADTLRGSNTPQRKWWNVKYYDLHVLVHPSDSTIIGSNTITYKVINQNKVMQIDLQKPMHIDKVEQNGKPISFVSDGNAHFLQLQSEQKVGTINKVKIYFSGRPHVAKKPPWDGGIVWTIDSTGKPWVANANEGIGASVWWPLKDYSGDEPDDGMTIAVTTPKELVDVSNGRLDSVVHHKNTTTWVWEVKSPINAYGVNLCIGNYVHWQETYQGENGPLTMTYYVLKGHKAKAMKQFRQAKKMMHAFEYWMGPYPFYKDGYKLVEAPYLGMEHQSCVAYGNHFENGYLGSDLSGTGWGMKFDFIIIHESGHEWFANNITAKDVADMWIQEGFTCYSESLFLEYYYGKKAASQYIIGLRKRIENKRALIGNYGVHDNTPEDIYWKGANILNTLRTWINNDTTWRAILRGLNKTFYHQTVTTAQIENYIAKISGLDLTTFWNQYLRTTKIPMLEYKVTNDKFQFRYSHILADFSMPVDVVIDGKKQRIYPAKKWKTITQNEAINSVKINPNYYIFTKKETSKLQR